MGLIEKNKLIIFLDGQDMDNFDITYNSISWQDEKTRTVIAKLLTLAQQKTGFSINKSKLSIEVMPQFNGCAILFTLKTKHIIKSEPSSDDTYKPIILNTNNVENIMSLCETSGEFWTEIESNTLFLLSNQYFLLVYPKDKFSDKFLSTIEEYGITVKSNPVLIAWLKENSKIICENNALQRIGNCITKTK